MANLPTLSKFGVPLNGTNLGILHPKQKYRFRVIWYGLGFEDTNVREMTANVIKVSRPKITYEEITLHAYNSVAWIQGKHTFDAIEVTIRDDITNAIGSAVGAQVQKQMNHYEQTSAVAGVNYKFGMEIHALDGTKNEELESWVLEGCWIQAAANSEGEYSSGESQEITLTIKYDNATNIKGRNTNLGTTVGGDPYPNRESPRGGTTFA